MPIQGERNLWSFHALSLNRTGINLWRKTLNASVVILKTGGLTQRLFPKQPGLNLSAMAKNFPPYSRQNSVRLTW